MVDGAIVERGKHESSSLMKMYMYHSGLYRLGTRLIGEELDNIEWIRVDRVQLTRFQ